MNATTPTQMLSALEKKLGKDELRRQIDALRRDPDTGYSITRTLAAVSQIYYREFPEGENK